jgi:hypothetical protein
VTALDGGPLTAPLQPLLGIGADRVQHAESGRAIVGLHGIQEALVTQQIDPVQHRALRCPCRRALLVVHRLRRLQREIAGEDGEPAEEPSLVLGEQVDTPVDGRAQRLLPPRQIARSPCEERQRGCQPL